MSAAALLLAFFTVASGNALEAAREEPPAGVVIYRSDRDDRALAYSLQYHDFKPFSGPYRSAIWRSDIGGYFDVQVVQGIRYEKFTGVSLPDDIETRGSWQIEGYRCDATKFASDRWLVQCGGPASVSFIYRKKVGVTGLTFRCGPAARRTVCWFDLKTETGLFSEQ